MASRGSPSPRRPYRGNTRGGRGRGRGGPQQEFPSSPTSSPGRGRGARGTTPPPSSPGRGRGRGNPTSPRPDRAPRGICDYYWSTGSCRRGFECTYSHEAPNGFAALSQPDQPSTDDLDFFSMEGLTINNGSIRSEEQNMKPAEVHNHLKSILRGGELTTASKALGMVRIFGSVNSRNPHWVRLLLILFIVSVKLKHLLFRTVIMLRLVASSFPCLSEHGFDLDSSTAILGHCSQCECFTFESRSQTFLSLTSRETRFYELARF